ncbi:MAG: hypothetical protein HFJ51_07430 [Clostridia bacterium]|nr:hypothetical protein [Clostridia bacterium]
MPYHSKRSSSKKTRELDFNARPKGASTQRYIVNKINRIIRELNEPPNATNGGKAPRRIELAGNLQDKSIRFISKTFGITPHSSFQLGHGYTRCFFWIRKDTPLASLDEDK